MAHIPPAGCQKVTLAGSSRRPFMSAVSPHLNKHAAASTCKDEHREGKSEQGGKAEEERMAEQAEDKRWKTAT